MNEYNDEKETLAAALGHEHDGYVSNDHHAQEALAASIIGDGECEEKGRSTIEWWHAHHPGKR